MNRKRTELFVGLFLFVGLCLVGGLILKFGNIGDYFRARYSLELRYPSAGGLLKGSEVKYSGVTIGRVSSAPRPNSDFTGAIIELSIFEEYPVPRSAKISIEASGFLGDSYVEITPPEEASTDYFSDGESVEGAPSGGLTALANSAGDLSERGKEVVQDMRVALSELNSALSKLDTSILGEENLENFDETSRGLRDAVNSLNEGVLSETNAENLRVALENFRKTSENFATVSENVAASSKQISPILESAQATVDKAQSAVGKADDAITEITEAAREINSAVQRATTGPGLIAAMMNDAELRNDFTALISNLRETGVLRYRDNAPDLDTDIPSTTHRRGILRNR